MADNTLTKAELIAAVAEKTGNTKAETERLVKALQDTVVDSVVDGKTVRLTGFAVFEPKTRAARVGHNPQTGKEQQFPEKKVVKIRPLGAFADAVAGD